MAYTPIIAPADLSTHVYADILNEITRDNDAIAEMAIANAIAETSMFLSRYDLAQLFGSPIDDTSATFSDPFLTSLVKDIAVWNLIKLANPNISYEHIRKCYEDALDKLKLIQSGKADPRWPYLDTTGITTPPGISVSITSNPKRTNHF